ncbi:MAG: hypothetical protein IEMM0008_1820 [bacterium]|nr:MAG: hypothetical protein IEMM0008_1820 [bacterium]
MYLKGRQIMVKPKTLCVAYPYKETIPKTFTPTALCKNNRFHMQRVRVILGLFDL